MKIRVLWLIKGLGLGGAEILLARAVPHLDRERFEYEVAYLLPWKDAVLDAFAAPGIPTHCLEMRSQLDQRWVGRLSRLLRTRRYDIVHVHSPHAAAVVRLIARRMNGTRPRICYTEHNTWQRYHRATFWANALTYPLNDHVFAVSEGVRRSVRRPRILRRATMPAIETLHEGIDYQHVTARARNPAWRAAFGIPATAPVVGSVGNLKAVKGYDVLFDAWRRVARVAGDAHLVIVGTGPEQERLERLAAHPELRGRVHLAGSRSDALDLIADFDVFVLGSRHEGFPIAALEAMALGVPVVATQVGGLPEAIDDGVHGFLVPPEEPAALAERVATLLRDHVMRARLGAAAHEKARGFDNRLAVRRREEVYLRMVGR